MGKKKPTLHQAAEQAIEAMESESLPKIRKAKPVLADALTRDKARYNVGRNAGAKPKATDEQIRATIGMTAEAAATECKITANAVRRRRAKLRAADEATKPTEN